MTALANRYDIVFPVRRHNGNPNGDPDAGNLPRMDPETNKGFGQRRFAQAQNSKLYRTDEGRSARYRIYVQEGSILNEKHRGSLQAVRGDTEKVGKDGKLNPQNDDGPGNHEIHVRQFSMSAFGAVMSTGINAGSGARPVQVTFASSVDQSAA